MHGNELNSFKQRCGAVCEDSGYGLKSRKTHHIFLPSLFLKVLKVKFLIKINLKNLKGAFTHDTTELPNYN